MTRPWRRMIRHLLQIFLTLGLSFTGNFFLVGGWGALSPHTSAGPRVTPMPLLVPVNDATAAQVVRAELNDHPVVRQDTDVVHPHLPADVGEYLVPVVQLHTEEGIRQRLAHRALNL